MFWFIINKTMEAIFRIRANQIDHGFIDSIKKMFKEKDLIIRITVTEDETEYLASNERCYF